MLSTVQIMNNDKERTMDKEDTEEEYCYGKYYEEINRECKRCFLEKDCRDERKRLEKKKKQTKGSET